MRRVAMLALVAVLGGATAGMTAVRAAIPRDFLGTWKGQGSQSDPPGEWTIAIAITDGRPGTIVGMIAYPSEICGGDLVLRSSGSERLELTEDITYGNCIDDGIITLTLGDGGLRYEWRHSETPTTARGTLTRARR